MQKLFQPDAAAVSGGAPLMPKKANRKTIIPSKDADLETVTKNVADKWAGQPALTLMWTSQPALAQLSADYGIALGTRLQTGSNKPLQTAALKAADKQIDIAVRAVKTYLLKKYETEAAAIPHYAKFGLERENRVYKMAMDRDKRTLALPLMKAAVATEGFGAEKYGTDFWDTTITNYNAAIGASTGTTKKISTDVSLKDSLRQQIVKHLEAIVNLLQANYPDTWEAELRAWGFLKTSY